MRCLSCGAEVPGDVWSCPHCGGSVVATAPPPPMAGVAPRAEVGRLGQRLVVLLLLNAVALLAGTVVPDPVTITVLRIVEALLFVSAAIVTFVWMYRVRTNVTGRGRQRLGRPWAVWGWICPVVLLWFPLWIVSDIDKVDVSPGERVRALRLRGLWWACWLAAWVTGVRFQPITMAQPNGTVTHGYFAVQTFAGTLPSGLFAVAAAVLFALVVHGISARQERARAAGH